MDDIFLPLMYFTGNMIGLAGFLVYHAARS